MIEISGDIFDYLSDKSVDAICIFTNGITNKNGLAIAGAGQAGVAASHWWNFRYNLGNHLKENGNITGVVGKLSRKDALLPGLINPYWNKEFMSAPGIFIIAFPTKQHFNNPAIPKLIRRSTQQLLTISNRIGLNKIVMGRPGCGFKTGQLSWEQQVKPILDPLLDDRFIIVNKL